MQTIFASHGAVELTAPLMMPGADPVTTKNAAQFMDVTGGIVHLPYDLTTPFARYIAQYQPSTASSSSHHYAAQSWKKYTFGHVYRQNIVGGQPRTALECDFDIVDRDTAHFVHDAEVVKVALDVLCRFPAFETKQLVFSVCHADIIHLFFVFFFFF